MADVIDSLPSRPPPVRSKDRQEAEHSTGIETSNPPPTSKRRQRRRVPTDGSLKSHDAVDSSLGRQKAAQLPLNSHLNYFSWRFHDCGAEQCVFLCWKSGKSKHIAIDVPIHRDMDEKETYQRLRDGYYRKRFFLRRFLFFPSLEQVKMRLIGLPPDETDHGFLDVLITLPKPYRERYNELLMEQGGTHEKTDRVGYIPYCYQDLSTGIYHHAAGCETQSEETYGVCLEKALIENRRAMDNLETM